MRAARWDAVVQGLRLEKFVGDSRKRQEVAASHRAVVIGRLALSFRSLFRFHHNFLDGYPVQPLESAAANLALRLIAITCI